MADIQHHNLFALRSRPDNRHVETFSGWNALENALRAARTSPFSGYLAVVAVNQDGSALTGDLRPSFGAKR